MTTKASIEERLEKITAYNMLWIFEQERIDLWPDFTLVWLLAETLFEQLKLLNG